MMLHPSPLAGVVAIETRRIADQRGAFSRLYCETELADVLGERRIVQINHSRTELEGAVRGLHYQRAPHAEMKFIRCVRGRVWDVAVDLRAGSPTFLGWHAQELTPENNRMLVIPEGCAHGFQVLEAGSELLYLHTAFYMPDLEGGVHCEDPRLGIAWPLPVRDLSRRDAGHASLATNFKGLQP